MKNYLMACTFLLLSCSCEAVIQNIDGGYGQYDKKATIIDCSSRCDYKVLTIDDQPPRRAQHGRIVTRAPIIIVEPGIHTFGIQNIDGKAEPIQYVTAHVNSEREYFFRKLQDKYIIEIVEPGQ